jgi:hypothetical protein
MRYPVPRRPYVASSVGRVHDPIILPGRPEACTNGVNGKRLVEQ